MAPPEYQALHPMGTAPIVTDGARVLGESGAIVEYLIATHGGGRLAVRPEAPAFADYLYWLHFANGTLQPALLQLWLLERAAPSLESAPVQRAQYRFLKILDHLADRLGQSHHLSGPELTRSRTLG